MPTVLTPTYSASVQIGAATDYDSLASSTTFISGWQTGTIDNSTGLFMDAHLAGRFKANATAPTAGFIEVWVGALLDDTNYPDTMTATASVKTITTADIKQAILAQVARITTDATANRVYEFKKTNIAMLFGGAMPVKWFVFVTHNMVQSFNTTSGTGGALWYTGIKYTQT